MDDRASKADAECLGSPPTSLTIPSPTCRGHQGHRGPEKALEPHGVEFCINSKSKGLAPLTSVSPSVKKVDQLFCTGCRKDWKKHGM